MKVSPQQQVAALRTSRVKRESIRIDGTLYPRYKPSKGVSADYARAMESGSEFPAVKIDQHGRLIDGLHRLQALDARGAKEIVVERIRVRDDSEFFALALAANAHHGHRYTHIDYAHMVIQGRKLGIPDAKIATLVNVTPGFLDTVTRDWFARDGAGEPVALKSSIKHMRGQQLTDEQAEANTKLSGMQPRFFMNQVMLLLDNDLIDTENESLLATIDALAESIRVFKQKLGKRGRSAT